MVINTVGHLAEAAWHHPDITASYAWVEVRLQNHAAKGITDKDFELAKKIEDVVHWQPGKARRRARRHAGQGLSASPISNTTHHDGESPFAVPERNADGRAPGSTASPCALDAAVAEAARLLGASRLPVIAGLGTDIAGARAAIALAERIGGVDRSHASGRAAARPRRHARGRA